MDAKKVVPLIIAGCLILVGFMLPVPEGLTAEGLRGLCLLAAVIVLYITEALPFMVTTLAGMALMPLLGVLSFSEVWPAFGNSAIFFMMASFGVSAGLKNTHIPHLITRFILGWSQGEAGKLCLGFMAGAALVSGVMSDIPTCAIFGALALQLLEAAGLDKPGRTSLGTALMVSVPVGAIIGGFATPAGNGLNIMVINAAQSIGGVNLTFAQWSAVGIPLGIAMVAFCSWWVKHVFKPESIEQKIALQVRDDLEHHARLTVIDAKYLIILGFMIILWISSSWIPFINVTLVSIFGVAVMHLPGISVLTGKDFVSGVSWESFVMCGGIIALGTGVQSTGAIAWIVNLVLSSAGSWPVVLVLLTFSVIACLIHLATPVAGAIYALTCAPLLTAAVTLGIDPVVVALIVGVWICISFMQPLDLVYMLTYGYGYYSMPQLVRFGIAPTVLLIALTITWIPAICLVL